MKNKQGKKIEVDARGMPIIFKQLVHGFKDSEEKEEEEEEAQEIQSEEAMEEDMGFPESTQADKTGEDKRDFGENKEVFDDAGFPIVGDVCMNTKLNTLTQVKQ